MVVNCPCKNRLPLALNVQYVCVPLNTHRALLSDGPNLEQESTTLSPKNRKCLEEHRHKIQKHSEHLREQKAAFTIFHSSLYLLYACTQSSKRALLHNQLTQTKLQQAAHITFGTSPRELHSHDRSYGAAPRSPDP